MAQLYDHFLMLSVGLWTNLQSFDCQNMNQGCHQSSLQRGTRYFGRPLRRGSDELFGSLCESSFQLKHRINSPMCSLPRFPIAVKACGKTFLASLICESFINRCSFCPKSKTFGPPHQSKPHYNPTSILVQLLRSR